MNFQKQRVFGALTGGWIAAVGAFVFVTTVAGVIRYASPIPFSDQWIGGVGFLNALDDGNRAIWWSQHMEHRIVFSRALFWLDARWFGGRNTFLFVAGVVLQTLTATLFVTQAARGRRAGSLLAVGGIAFAFLFSWIQNENFTWAFQSQFFAVYLFSFLAFAVFTHGVTDGQPRMLGLVGAMLPALLATASMGNGLLAFGLLAFQALLMRRTWKELAFTLVATAIVGALYMHGFHKPDIGLPHLPLSETVRLVPHFFLSFMGVGPFFLTTNFTIAQVFGAASLIVMTALTVRLYLTRQVTPYRAFLITGYAFVVITGLAATSGRYPLGIGQSVVSRYGTPMFVSWTCVFLLALDVLDRARLAVLLSGAALATWVATFQMNVFGARAELYQRDLAVLAMKIGVDHPELVQHIFFPHQRAYLLKAAKYAEETNFGPYASGWLHDAGLVKFDPALVDSSVCRGSYDALRHPETGFDAQGWALNKRGDRLLIVLTDADSKTVGYGVTGSERLDVAKALGSGKDSGWTAFTQAGTNPVKAYGYSMGRFCPLPAQWNQ